MKDNGKGAGNMHLSKKNRIKMLKEVYELKTNLQKQSIRRIALDNDETLTFTLKNWFARIAKRFGNPENLPIEALIKKYRYIQNVPYWHTPEIFDWVVANVYDDKLQEELEVIGEANKYVPQLHKTKNVVAYISNRPIEVAKGTKTWLIKHGFPQAPLILRPSYIHYTMSHQWKAAVLDYLYPEIEAYVDDNFEVLEYLPDTYQGHIFLYDLKQYDHKLANVHACSDWPAVVAHVKNIFNKNTK